MANYTQYVPQLNSTTYPVSINNAFTAMTADVTALETGKLSLTGGTMTGSLTLSSGTITIGAVNVATKDGTLVNGNIVYADGNGDLSTANSVPLSVFATLASPTFTGTVVLPGTTSIGATSATELGFVNGVTSAIQTQIDNLTTIKSPLASPTFTGVPSGPTAAPGTNTTQFASTAFVDAVAVTVPDITDNSTSTFLTVNASQRSTFEGLLYADNGFRFGSGNSNNSITPSAGTLTLTGTSDGTWWQIGAGNFNTIVDGVGHGAGSYYILWFQTGGNTITHSPSQLNLPTGADIVTEAGDIMVVYQELVSDWEVVSYQRNSGKALAETPSPAFRGALVYASYATSVPNTTTTRVDYGAETYDTDAIHDNATNNSRLTVPSGVTRIKLVSQVRIESNATGIRRVTIAKNNGANYSGRGVSFELAPTVSFSTIIQVESPILTVTSGDYFETHLYQDSGSTLNVLNDLYENWFSMEIIE